MGCMPKLRTEAQRNREATGRHYQRPRLRQIRVEPDPLTSPEWSTYWQRKYNEAAEAISTRPIRTFSR